MPKSDITRTVSATCQCGTSFTREVKRGRPQVWCPACMAIPFAKRITAPVAVKPEIVTEADGTERPVNQWDVHDAIRVTIEANVAAVYAGWPAVAAEMRAQGADAFAIGHAQLEALRGAYRAAGVGL